MHPRRLKKIGTALGVVLFATIALAETAFWIGHRISQPETGSGTCAVLVLGYPTQANGQPHPVQQRRVSAGVAAYHTHQCSRIVMSGGAAQNDYIEAVSMMEIAQNLGMPANKIVLEDQAQNTWENVG